MDYFKIIKKAAQITLKNKHLWILGILAAFTESGIGVPNFNFNSDNFNQIKNWLRINNLNSPSLTPASNLVKNNILGNKISIDNLSNWLQNHLTTIIIICLIVFFIIIIIYVISQMAKAGLIWGVSEIESNRKTDFKKCFQKGYHLFWCFLELEILIGLTIFATFLFYISSIIYMIVLHLYVSVIIIWSLILFIPIMLLFIFLGILRQYALRYIAINSNGVGDSIHNAFYLFKSKLKNVLAIWLVSIILNIIISVILALIIVTILIGVGAGLFFALGKLGIIIAGIFFGLIFLFIYLFISGILTTFNSSYWTLAFLELADKNKEKIV